MLYDLYDSQVLLYEQFMVVYDVITLTCVTVETPWTSHKWKSIPPPPSLEREDSPPPRGSHQKFENKVPPPPPDFPKKIPDHFIGNEL